MFNLRTRRPIGRSVAAFTILGLTAVLFPVLATTPAGATDPNHVSLTLEGCDNDGGAITLPIAGKFVCPDSAYNPGNLGKGWSELDLVPYRVTAQAGNQSGVPDPQTYTVAIAVDHEDGTPPRPGYDVLSEPVLNTDLSTGTCTLNAGDETILSPGIGGISKTLYRLLTITQPKDTTCVYDYYARLALGSHLFPGSSLHANLALPSTDRRGNVTLVTAGIGAQDRSIPVKEILPQEIKKDMSATQGSDHAWDITKSSTPDALPFGDTCSDITPASFPVQIKVSWTRSPADPSGPITVITHVYARQPGESDDHRPGE